MGAAQAMGSASQMEEKYFLQKVKLGQGNFGTVYRAVDRKSEELVAIKQLDKRALPQLGIGRPQVNKEIAILRTCAHVNVTELYGTYEDANCIYLALEYCDGGDFADKVKEKGLAVLEGEAADWVLQMCEAVAAIHSRGVCHRDIKLDNFMLKVEKTGKVGGMLKLTDFGLATEVPRGALLYEQCGTAPFMAPELHSLPVHRQGYSFPVDVWATGVSMYCVMFGGRHPFTNNAGVLDKRLLCQASMDFREPGMKGTLGGQRFSDEARQLCRWMVALDPARRMSAWDARGAAAAWASKTVAPLLSRGPDLVSRASESISRPTTPQVSRSRSVSFDEFGAAGGPMASRSRTASLEISTVFGSLLPRSDSFLAAFLGQQSVPAVEDCPPPQQSVEELGAQCKDLRSRAERCAQGDLLPAAELKGAEVLCRALQQVADRATSDVEAKETEVQDLQARLGRTEAQSRELREQRDRGDRELARKAEDLARLETAVAAPRTAAERGPGGAGEEALLRAEARCAELQRLVARMEADADARGRELARLREAPPGPPASPPAPPMSAHLQASRGAGRGDWEGEAAHGAEALRAAMQEQAERSAAQLSAKSEELSKLRQQHEQLQRACADAKGAMAEELGKARAQISRLQGQLQAAEALAAATAEDAAAPRESGARVAEVEELRRERSTSLHLRQRLEARQAEAGDSSKELAVLRAQSRELQSQLARRDAETVAKAQELERARALCKDLSERVLRAEADAASSQEELLSTRGLCQQLREQASRQEAECRAEASEKRQAEARCRRLGSEVSQKEMQATVARQDLQREQSRCQELEERLEALRADLPPQTAHVAAEGELGRARVQLEQARSQLREEKLNEGDPRAQSLHAQPGLEDLQDLREQLAQLKAEVAEHRRVRTDQQEELNTLRKGWLAPAAIGPPAGPGAVPGASRGPKGRFRLPQALRRSPRA